LDSIEIGAALGVAAEAGLMKWGDGDRALELIDEIRKGTPLGRILGSGAGMGYSDDDYRATSPRVHVVDEATAYGQDIVVVLRAPEGRYELLRPGAILLSMLHFTTRPERVELLRLESGHRVDMIAGDDGGACPEPARVARNGLAAASTPSSAAGRRCSRPRAHPSASRSWAPAGSASTPSSGRPGPATRRATRGCCGMACPGSRLSWPSRTWPATRRTSDTGWP
jgi:hypothetical protein